jgi:hypothetical protein
MVAGGCTVRRGGVDLHLIKPTIIDSEEAAAAFPRRSSP